MAQPSFSNIPLREEVDFPYDQSPSPSSISGDSASSQSSYDSQSTNTSYGSEDGDADHELDNRVPQQLTKARTWAAPSYDVEAIVVNQEPARFPFPQQLPHPRRTSTAPAQAPPSLLRDTQRKDQFVNNLVGKVDLSISKLISNFFPFQESAAIMVEVIWPLAGCERHNLTLRTYIQEILKRTKTSFSTLQVALFYILLVKAHVPFVDFTQEQPRDMSAIRGFGCGRRMFLSAIILASKYLQDRNYSSKAWSKITSLPVEEINANETAFLKAVQWKLHIPESKFDRWQHILVNYSHPTFAERWKEAVRVLRPELDNLPPLSVGRIDTAVSPISSQPSPMLLSPSPLATGYPTPVGSPLRINTPPAAMACSPMATAPLAPKIARLATPQFKESFTSFCQTPAVGFAKGPNSMRSAMCIAQSVANARCVQDVASARPYAPSLASSPESMISDHSSTPSRSSSISSTSSLPLVPENVRLAHIAQLNAFKGQISLGECTTLNASPENIVVECANSPSPTELEHSFRRKRARGASIDSIPISTAAVVTSRPDSTLQQEVRRLVSSSYHAQASEFSSCGAKVAAKMVYSHVRYASADGVYAVPAVKRMRSTGLQQDQGVWRPEGGPGMWHGIIN
jgi:PHO85 cyclin-5